MSVTGDYMLILGWDVPERGTQERHIWDRGHKNGELLLDDSMEKLSFLIDKVEWWGQGPIKNRMHSHLVYFWQGTLGPYFKAPDSAPPAECLIEMVKKEYPNCEAHYTKLWWVEQQLFEVEGRLLENNGPETFKTVVIQKDSSFIHPGIVDIRDYFTEMVT